MTRVAPGTPVSPWLGEGLGCHSEWTSLITCLKPQDQRLIPPRLRTLAIPQLIELLESEDLRTRFLAEMVLGDATST